MSRLPTFLNIIEKQLLPWMTQNSEDRFIVAQPTMAQMRSKTGLRLSPNQIRGPRKIMRGFNFSGITAKWPNDNLIEAHQPLLFFVLGGETDFLCGDYVMHIQQGHAVFVPAGIPRANGSPPLKEISDNPQRFSNNILFHERCGSLEIWLNHDRGNHHFRSKPNELLMVHNTRLIRVLQDIQEELTSKRQNSSSITQHLLEVFLLMVQRDLHEKKAIHPGRLIESELMAEQNYHPIHQAQQYIREHLHEHLTLDNMAQRVRLSRTQFIKKFREETGKTFNDFVTECRLEQAKVLLVNTVFPITFICSTLGYKSNVHFYRMFRKNTGMLPSEYRRDNSK